MEENDGWLCMRVSNSYSPLALHLLAHSMDAVNLDSKPCKMAVGVAFVFCFFLILFYYKYAFTSDL